MHKFNQKTAEINSTVLMF